MRTVAEDGRDTGKHVIHTAITLPGGIIVAPTSPLVILTQISVRIERMSAFRVLHPRSSCVCHAGGRGGPHIGGLTNRLNPINGCAAWARFPGCADALVDIVLCGGTRPEIGTKNKTGCPRQAHDLFA